MGKRKRRRFFLRCRSQGRKKRDVRIRPFGWIILGMLFLLWLFHWPDLQPFRDSVLYQVLLRSSISVPYLYFAFGYRNRPTGLGQLLVLLTVGMTWLPMLDPGWRVTMMLLLFLEYGNLGAALWYQIVRRSGHHVLWVAAADVALRMLAFIEVGIQMVRGFSFLTPTLLMAVVTALVCCWLIWSGRLVLKDDRLSERIAVGIIAFFVGLMLMWESCVCVNFCLDASTPVTYQAVLEEKDVSSGKQNSYYFYMTVEGEKLQFYVTQRDYYYAQIGDEYVVERYEGFLGEPYHIIWETEKESD